MHINLCLNIDKGKFEFSWLWATEGLTQDKNWDIDFGWILLEKKKTTFISVIISKIREEDLWNLKVNSQLGFLNF